MIVMNKYSIINNKSPKRLTIIMGQPYFSYS